MNKTKILFVDDDPVTCSVMERNCNNHNIECSVFQSPEECLREFELHNAQLIVSDLRMPGMTGFELLKAVRLIDPTVPFLVMTGYSSVENAVEAMKLGATDFIKKPFDFEELKIIIDRNLESARLRDENSLLKQQIHEHRDQFGMIGHSAAMESLFNKIEKISNVSCHVIINGESGTGKELVARALHEYSPCKNKPFIVIDCGALTESLLESELFGHEKGAFTGAIQRKKGLMEQASGGTLFLDEISNISDVMQMKLMRATESQVVTRVGSTDPIEIDLRVIAASNRDLEKMVEEGTFRHDFYHRLNVVNIHVPALSERREDIPALIDAFVIEFSNHYKRKISGFDSASMRRLMDAEWPGNVRELRNAIERSVILADDEMMQWPENITDLNKNNDKQFVFPNDHFLSLQELERRYIDHVLLHSDGNRSKAARVLQIDKTTLWRKLKRQDEVS